MIQQRYTNKNIQMGNHACVLWRDGKKIENKLLLYIIYIINIYNIKKHKRDLYSLLAFVHFC